MPFDYEIREFAESYREEVIGLWEACGLTRPWNNPDRDIDRILSNSTGRLFLMVGEDRLLGSVMAGYDGHRGYVYYLSVHPDFQKSDLGRALMEHSENYLQSLGCPKLNLNIRETNKPVIGFYDRLGYQRDDVVTMSKRLIVDPERDRSS